MADAFQPKFVDLVRNITTTTGTANFTLGQAASGFTSFTAACAVGDRFYYSVVGIDKPGEREIGRGTLLSGSIVSRDPIGGVKTNFSNGTKSIALIASSEWYSQAQQVVASVSPFGQALTGSTDAAAARDALGIGSAGLEPVARFTVALPDRAALAVHTASSTAFLNERGREGLFVWDGSNQASAVAADTAQGIMIAANGGDGSSGAWVRKFSGPVDPRWFGVSTTNTGAQNDAAMLAMFAALRATANITNSLYQGLCSVRFPPGYFEFASTIDITDGTLIFEGAGSGSPGGLATVLKFPLGQTGIRVQRFNTSSATTKDAVTHRGGDGTIIRNLALYGGLNSGIGIEGEFHGIHLRARAAIRDVFIQNFQGDGIYSVAAAGLTPEGNANNAAISMCRIQWCRNGIFIDGADTNIWGVDRVDCSSNRQWGIWDSSFLGNSYFACHADSNGAVPSGPPSMVAQGGNIYCVKFGQEAGASTNAPSGTTDDNAWWYYMNPGGANAGRNIAAWAAGTTYRSAGSYLTEGSGNARNVLCGCYQESGQGLAQNAGQKTLIVGGIMDGGTRGAAVLTGALTGAVQVAGGGLTVDSGLSAYGVTHVLGSQYGGAASNPVTNFDTNNSSHSLIGRINQVGGPLTIGSITFTYGFGIAINAANATWTIRLQNNGVNIALVKSAGIDLQAGKILSVNGTQVVSARVTGWALDTGTAKRTANATYNGVAEAAYTQATVQALMDTVRDFSQTVKALKDDLHAAAGHGLIG